MNISKAPAYNNKGNLVEGPVGKHLVRLAVPMTWGIMMVISFQLMNVFFISLLHDTNILAAISFTFPLTYMLFSIFLGFGIAMSSVISRLIGSGATETVQRVTSHGIIFSFLFSILITIAGLALHDPLFRLMGAPDSMLPLIHQYMSIWLLGFAASSVPWVGNAAIRAGGDSITPAKIMTIAALLNMALDAILILGLLGAPQLGLKGAAIANVISNVFMLCASLYVLCVRQKFLSLRVAMRHINEFGDSIKRLIFIALPVGITNSFQPIVNVIILSLLAKHSVQAVAAFGVVTRIEAFAFIVLMGVAVGMAPIIGQNWGAGRFDRVNQVIHLAMRFNVLWSLGIAIILGVSARPIASIFSNDPGVVHYAIHFFWLVPFSYAFSNLINGWASAFNAMGMPQRSFMMIVIKLLVLMIPAIYIGSAMAGIMGIFIAIAGVNVVTGVIFHLWSWNYCRKLERTNLSAISQTAL